MNLNPIITRLSPRRAAQVANVVSGLQAAIELGMVPNKMITEAKDILNRATDEAVEAFLKEGPHNEGHHQSDWWLGAYRADAMVRGMHGVPAALKRVQKAGGLTDYAALLTSLLPLRDLLESAKPLIKKRGELPVVKSAKQLADEADQMTCQCCGRGIFAATGVIAHHGYERPGSGWQTASCPGARELPFEVSRDELGRLINHMRDREVDAVANMSAVANGLAPVVVTIPDHSKQYDARTCRRPTKTLEVTRSNFTELGKEIRSYTTFDALLKSDIDSRSRAIKSLRDEIAAQQARFNGWKQTHTRVDGKWVEV